MKITTFNPQIITNHLAEVVGLFEALGFDSKSVALVGPIGFTIYLVQHKK